MKLLTDSAKKRLVKWLADQLPTLRRTLYNVRQMQSERAPDLDVDQIHAIIEEAQAGNIDGLMRLYRDMILTSAHLQGRFVERKEAVLGDTLSIQPADDDDPDDVTAAAVVQDMVENCQDWEKAMAHALDSGLWPVALLEKTFRVSARVVDVADQQPVSLQYELDALTVVPYELLTHVSGRLQIRDTDEAGNPLGTYQDPDPGRYIIHRGHLLTSVPDNWGGPMRSLVFWWLLGNMSRDWWSRFLDRYGAPFVVGKYDQNDDASRSILERAFSYATKIGGLVVSRDTEIELEQANTTGGGDAFDKFREACNQEIANLVLGQSLSSNAKSTGLGSGVSRQQEKMRQDKRAADARRLGATFRYQLAEQFLRINGLAGRPPKFMWGADTPDESTATGEMLVALKNSGLQPTDDAIPIIGEKMGFPVERAPMPVPPPIDAGGLPGPAGRFGIHTAVLSSFNSDVIAGSAAASLAQILGRHHAPVAQIIRASRSQQEAMVGIESYFKTHSVGPRQAARVIEEVLVAYAANGSVAVAR